MREPLKVSSRESSEVGAEFAGHQGYAVLGQRDTELSCTTADLENAASVVKLRQRDDTLDNAMTLSTASCGYGERYTL